MMTGIFVFIFFFSGAAALGFQVVWAKGFAAAIGHEYPAVLAVVTAFMAGMALGNVLLIRRRTMGTYWYGWMEIVIGLWALATMGLTPLLEGWLTKVLGVNPGPAFHWTVVFGAVLVVLLPATTAMGATLPAAERFLARRVAHHTTGLLYGANTAGGTLGAVLAAFWLMPMLGIRGSVIVCAVVSISCGIGALMLARLAREETGPKKEIKETQRSGMSAVHFGWRLAACGLLGIGFEVVIIRALAHVLENTVYTFAVVLAVYLVGNAAGAVLFYRVNRRREVEDGGVLFVALALACAVVAMTVRWSAPLYSWLRVQLGDSVGAVALAEASTAAAFFLVPALLMGATWTWLAQRSLMGKTSLAWAVAINMAGGAVAPMFFGLLVLPLLGLKWALAMFPIGYALLGGNRRLVGIGVVGALLISPLATSVRELVDAAGGRIIALREGVMGSVAVIESANGARVLKFNNRFQMGGTAARVAEERQAHIPLLLHAEPKRALFIGLGTGITFQAAASYPGLEPDGVELVPEIAAAMGYFNEGAETTSAKLRTYIADGRRFVRAAEGKYDVIVSDLFHPAQDGAGFLYTVEHFAAIRERLASGGLFCQWLPVYQMDLETLRIVMRTLARVFPESEVWLLRFNIDVPVVGLMARLGEEKIAHDLVERKMEQSATLAEQLKRVGINDTVRLVGCYVGKLKAAWDAELNTDLNPTLVFRAPALTFRKMDDPGERLLALMREVRSDSAEVLKDEGGFVRGVQKFVEARDVYLGGLKQESGGDFGAAVGAYIESARLSEDFTAGYAQALGIATGLARERPEQSRAILEKLAEARPERPVARELLERLSARSGEE